MELALRFPLSAATCWFLITWGTVVYSQPTEKCDVRLWYLDLVSEGLLSGDLTPQKQSIKLKIEKMMKKFQDLKGEKAMMDCHLLSFYDDLLKDDDHTKVTVSESNEATKDGQADQPLKEGTTEDVEQADDTELDETEIGDDDDSVESADSKAKQTDVPTPARTDDKSHKAEAKASHDHDITKPQPSASEETKPSVKKRVIEEYEFDPRRGYVKVLREVDDIEEETSQDKQDVQQTDSESRDEKSKPEHQKTPSGVGVEKQDQGRNRDEANIKPEKSVKPAEQKEKSENIKDTGEMHEVTDGDAKQNTSKQEELTKEQEKQDVQTKTASENTDKHTETLRKFNEPDSTSEKEKENENAVPVNTDIPKITTMTQDNLIHRKENINQEEKTHEEPEPPLSWTIQEMCSDYDFTYSLCYYSFGGRQCLENYPDINCVNHKGSEENSITLNANTPNPTDDAKVESETKDHVDAESVNLHSGHQLKKTSEKSQTNLPDDQLGRSSEKSGQLGRSSEKSQTNLPDDQVEKTSEKSQTSLPDDQLGKSSEKSQTNLPDGQLEKTSEKSQTSLPDDQLEKTSEKSQTSLPENQETREKNKPDRNNNINQFKTDLHRFELQFQQRASEYANKIQNLEIMIFRLENQLLSAQLDKQNDTNSFSKLENHILRLENELLKLNQSYVGLKEENEFLKSRHRKYLELGHDKSQQSALSDNATKHYELITMQQNKISSLTSLLKNHSVLFDKLQSKSQFLEEQNQMLYQIVMNQTALISNIMKKMHEMSEENMKHRQQTQDLRTHFQIKASSDRIMEKLDSLASAGVHQPQVVVAEDEESTHQTRFARRISEFFPKLPDAIIDYKLWTCDGKTLPQFCMFHSFVLSPCPPHSVVHWKRCPYFFKDLSVVQKDTHNSDSFQTSHMSIDANGLTPEAETLKGATENTNKDLEADHSQEDQEKLLGGTQGLAEQAVDQNTNEEKQPSETQGLQEQTSDQTSKEQKQFSKTEGLAEQTIDQNTKEKKGLSEPQSLTEQKTDQNMEQTAKSESDQVPEKESPGTLEESVPKADTKSDEDSEKVSASLKKADAASESPEEDAPSARDSQMNITNPNAERAVPTEEANTAYAGRPLLYTAKKTPKPKDCYGYYMDGYTRNGMYKIYLIGLEKLVPVFCDMKQGGWTLLLKRDGSGLDFFKEWNEYKAGFGGPYSEHWIGNDNLHFLTNQDYYKLRVELKDFNKDQVYAEYKNFSIENEFEGYRLHIEGYSGTAGDGFEKHNNMMFSTKDIDNDLVKKELKDYDSSCAKRFHGAWWYYKCYMSNLTGQYYSTGEVPNKKFDGISWKPWKKPSVSLKEVVMKVRPLYADE